MSNELFIELNDLLHFPDETVLVAMGNELRSDDAIGIDIGRQLINKLPKLADRILITYNVPVNYVNKIIKLKPRRIIFIDSVEMDDAPGKLIICNGDDLMKTSSLTTHYQELDDLLDYIQLRLLYLPEVYFLGIQIETTEVYGSISPRVQKAGDILVEMIYQVLQPFTPDHQA